MRKLSYFLLLINLAWPFVGHGQAFNQQLYEEMYQKKCIGVSEQEIQTLKCALGSPKTNIENLDELSEFLMFSDIATTEMDRLECLSTEIKRVMGNKEVKQQALSTTCSHLVSLQDSLDNVELLQKWIKSYETVNDGSLRIVPADERVKNDFVIQNLKGRLLLYQENIRFLKAHDPLLSSPTVFEKISGSFKKGMFGNRKTSDEVCRDLNSNIDQLLTKDANQHLQSKQFIQNKLKSKYWNSDSEFKQKLWSSSGRSSMASKVSANADLSQSAMCRMEARYGIGAVNGEKFKLIMGSAVGGFGIGWLARLAGPIWAKRTNSAKEIALLVTTVQVATGGSIIAYEVTQACKEKLKSVSGKRTCEAIDDTEFKNLFFQQHDSNECLIAGAAGTIFAGLSGLGIKGILKGKVPPALETELEERALATKKSNSLMEKLEEKWRNSDLQKASAKTTPRLTNSLEGLSKNESFDFLAKAYNFSDAQKGMLAKQLAIGTDLERMNSVLAQAASGQFVKFEEAAWASSKLAKAKIDGVFQFHGTSEKAMQGILNTLTSDGQPVLKTFGDVGIYAIPVAHKELNPLKSYWITGSSKAGNPEASIVFQGEAAQLFSSPKLPTVMSNTAYRGGTTRSPIGNLVIDEYSVQSGNIVVTKAHVVPLENGATNMIKMVGTNFMDSALIVTGMGMGIVVSIKGEK